MSPFKTRWVGRCGPGMLLTPDILKFQIPVPIAFVPADPRYNPRTLLNKKNHASHHIHENNTKSDLLTSPNYKNSKLCQQTVQNFNICLRNNGTENCQYYMTYLNKMCSL